MTLAMDSVAAYRQALAARLQPQSRRWATPSEMAQALDPRMVETPTLRLINEALVDLADGRDKRLMILAPPQEGKIGGSLALVPAVPAGA